MFTLHNGDCLTVLPSIPSGSIDAIITDLPYGTTACKWDTVIEFAPMWKEVKRVLKPNGAFITTASQPFTSALIMSNPSMFKCEWIWQKHKGTNFHGVKREPLKVHENCILFSSGKYVYNPQMTNGVPYKKRGSHNIRKENSLFPNKVVGYAKDFDSSKRYPVSVQYFSNHNQKRNSLHPTQKPVALYEYLIKTYTNEGETVLDIAMGSGTTIEAAERTWRNSIGIEKDEGIFQSAVLRLNSYTPSNNRLHWTVGDSPDLPSQSTLEGFTAPEADTTPPASQ